MLFPERSTQEQFRLESVQTTVFANTLKKVYLCGSSCNKIKQGDILLFYRSKDTQAITTVGIIERAKHINNLTELLSLVGKRSVYTYSQLVKMCQNEKVLVLEFRLARHLEQTIKRNQLIKLGLLKGVPQSIVKLTTNNVSRQEIDTFYQHIQDK